MTSPTTPDLATDADIVAAARARLEAIDTAGARALADRGLAQRADDPRLLRIRSDAHLLEGDLPAARDDLAAARAARRTQESELHLGLLHHALGEAGPAVERLQGALALAAAGEPGPQARTWVALMRLYRDLGYEPAADDAAEAALRFYAQKPVWISSTVSKLVNRRDYPGWDRVRLKDGLAAAIAALPRETRPPTPETYALPAERAALLAAAPGVWIAKTRGMSGGEGIHLTDAPARIDPAWEGVVQRYLARPFLADGRKSHLRLYLLITSVAPLRAWLWRDGLVRLAPAAYDAGALDRLDMHITNTALHEGHPGLVFDPDPKVEDRGSVQGLAAFLAARLAEPDALWPKLEAIARGLLAAFEGAGIFAGIAPAGRAFLPKLLGMDVVLDADGAPWLIELQRVPGQTGPGPVNTVNARLFREVLEMTVAPLPGPGPLPEREAAAEARAARRFVPLHGA